MAHLIDKDALVAEIEKLKTIYDDDENIHCVAKYNILIDILFFIDTLEVKDVDLEKLKEPASEDLEQAAIDYDSCRPALYGEDDEGDYVEYIEVRKDAFIAGAKWQECISNKVERYDKD